MKYNKEYIKDLLDKFMEGQTTENEEQMLSEFFANTEDISAEWMPYKEMFQSFKTDAYDFSEAELDEMLEPKIEKKSRIIGMLPWLSAACVAAVVLSLGIVYFQYSNTNYAVAYVNEEKISDENVVLDIGYDAVSEIFSNENDASEELQDIFNPN